MIVIGGGLAGLRMAKKLKAKLITTHELFVFLPRLPDALRLGEEHATRLIKRSHNDVVFGSVTRVDMQHKKVYVGSKSFSYDYLVLATGATSVLPVPGAKEYAIPFYSIDDLRRVKKRLPAKQIVVVGGGPTGVEVAAELSEHGKVTILESGSDILSMFPVRARKYARKELARLGVAIRVGESVSRISARSVVTASDSLAYDICVWCAGVRTDIPSGVPKNKGVLVDEYLRLQGQTHVFAAGDCAQSGTPLTAQAAVQEADLVVANIRRTQQSRPLKKLSYKHKGDMLSLGSRALVMPSFGFMLRGWLASQVRKAYYWWQLRSY